MKALILAAGYATRLYPLTLEKPKPLLKVGSKTIADRLVEKVEATSEIDRIYVVTNQKFSSHFEKWAKAGSYKIKIRVINDRTLTNETRLGAVGDMALVMKEAQVSDDVLVLGGDNLFEFDLKSFIEFARSKGGNAVALRDVGDLQEAKRYGIVTLNDEQKVTEFVEKPKDPKSTLAAMCVYYLRMEKLGLLKRYIDAGNNKDQPGYYISWLSENDIVYGYKIKGEWFDIGDKRLLKLADKVYTKKEEK
jgi:glucose-1-phosphate thymidylyltransferase